MKRELVVSKLRLPTIQMVYVNWKAAGRMLLPRYSCTKKVQCKVMVGGSGQAIGKRLLMFKRILSGQQIVDSHWKTSRRRLLP